MMIKTTLTPELACSYLTDEKEQLLVVQDDEWLTQTGYEVLLSNGFRRSGSDVYRPHCQACQACQSIRINVRKFQPSKSQRRLLNKNKDLRVTFSTQPQTEYYPLYERYINTLHNDGSMYPASQKQYDGFILSAWLAPVFIEFHLADKLIAVAVTDVLPSSMSAMYCFYDPDHLNRSLGSYAILQQLFFAQQWDKQWLYLGYQIDQCSKMNYKVKFKPHERFLAGTWHREGSLNGFFK